MSFFLKNKRTILVTRPQPMGQMLSDLLQKHEFETILFPTIQIKNINQSSCDYYFKDLKQYQSIIFTSMNAVSSVGLILLNFCSQQNVFPKLYGIGKTTAEGLKSLGFPAVFYPEADFNSENLLKELKITDCQTHFLIVTGEEGRSYLPEELEKKGAVISIFFCYQRLCPHNLEKNVWLKWKEKNLNTIVVTSQTAIAHLLKMLNKEGRTYVKTCDLLTFGPRITSYAQGLGFSARIDSISQASNENIVNFLLQKFK